MKYLLIPKAGDKEIIQDEIDSISVLTKDQLVKKYNRQVEIGIVGVRGQALVIFALAKVFIQVFGKSPITLEENKVLGLSGKIYLKGENFDFIENKEIEIKKHPKLLHQEMLSKLSKVGFNNLSDKEKEYWNSIY